MYFCQMSFLDEIARRRTFGIISHPDAAQIFAPKPVREVLRWGTLEVYCCYSLTYLWC